MKITFLIGNGYDLNLGLATSFKDYIKEYKSSKDAALDAEHIIKFKENISDNELLWSDAEKQFGQYSSHFEVGQGKEYIECEDDFCINLAGFLKRQEDLIDYNRFEDLASKSWEALDDIYSEFPLLEQEQIKNTYNQYLYEEIEYNFICFNYTRTLDRFIEFGKEHYKGIIGKHIYQNVEHKHFVKRIIHIHGTVEGDMVFGVNDDSQLARPDIFQEDFYKNFVLKSKANESYRNNKEMIASELINQSSIIYVYGMAIGETDKRWWERIGTWLKTSNIKQVILHCYEGPERNLPYGFKYQLFEYEKRKEFLSFIADNQSTLGNVMNQVHITKCNIFSDICGLV